MVPSRCGKDCSTCDLIGLCGGCHRYCLVERCLRRGYAVPGLTGDCNSCPFYECPKSRLGEMFESPLGAKTSRVRIKARVRKLPLFVPMIDVWGSDRWKGVRDVKAIAVKFHDLYERYGLLEEDIHETLGFRGKVLLLSMAPDEFLMPEWFRRYVEFVSSARPTPS